MAKPMRSVVRKQCSTRFHVQTQPLPVCTWHANPPELSARHCVAIQSVGVVRSCVRIGKPKGRQAHANPYVSARLPSSGNRKIRLCKQKIQTVQRKSAGINRKGRLCKRKSQKEQENYRKQQIKGCFTNENRDKQVEQQNNVSLKHNVS